MPIGIKFNVVNKKSSNKPLGFVFPKCDTRELDELKFLAVNRN